MKRLLLLLPILVLLAGCDGSSEDGAVGSTAPNFKVDTLIMPSTPVSLSSHRGKVVLVDFWATWCGPCRAITPTLEAMYAKYKDRGLDAMAISSEAHEIVSLNEKKSPHAMPVFIDGDESASRSMGVQGLPTIVVIDRTGHIAYQTTGFGETTVEEIRTAIEKSLGSA